MSHRTWISALVLWVLPGSAAAQHEFFVDGRTGTDRPDAGTAPTDPWRTITYALTRIPPPPPTASHALHIAGTQVYAPTTNGESFPLVVQPGIQWLGSARGVARPVLAPPAHEVALSFAPEATFDRTRDLLQDLVIDGGRLGIALHAAAGARHAPTLERCTITRQFGNNVSLAAGDGARVAPRLVQCECTGALVGVGVAGAGVDSVLRPELDECTVSATSTGLSLVGGALVFRSSIGGFTGIHLAATAGSRTTAVELVASQISGFDGVFLDLDRPAAGQVAIESCFFPGGGEEAVLVYGAFAEGSSFGISLSDNVVAAATHNGIAFELHGTGGDLEISSRRNLFLRNRMANGLSLRCDEGIRLRFLSSGDGAFDNGTGMSLSTGSSALVRLENSLFCHNDDLGLVLDTAAAPVTGSFLTLADNGQVGLWASAAALGVRLDHCVLAGNRTSELVLPAGNPVAWSCLQGQPWPGTGNLQADPRLRTPLYQLAPDSPCVDAGNPQPAAAPATDYEGDARALPGQAGRPPRADLGADEFASDGSAHPYGLAGLGREGLAPQIVAPAARAPLGAPLRIELRAARTRTGQPALAASLFAGATEASGTLPFDLRGVGAPGSFLWQELAVHLGQADVAADGSAALTLLVPADPALAGAVFTCQWLVLAPGANDAGLVTTQGLRVTLGR